MTVDRWNDRRVWAGAAAVTAVIVGCYRVHDPDIPWQVAAGRWILNHARFPSADPFSFTHTGAPWANHSPLFQALLAAIEHLTGFAGVSLARMAVLAFLSGTAVLLAGRRHGVDARIAAAVAPLPIALQITSTAARPQLFAYLCLTTTWAVLTVNEHRPRDRRWPWLLVPLYLVWRFGHVTHIALPGLAAVVLILHVLRKDRPRAKVLLMPVAAVVLLFAWLGREAVMMTVEHTTSPWQERYLSEWAAVDLTYLSTTPEGQLTLLLLGCIAIGAVGRALTLFRCPESREPSALVELALTLGLGALAVTGSERTLTFYLLGLLPIWLPSAAWGPSRLLRFGRSTVISAAMLVPMLALIAWRGGGGPLLSAGLGLDERRFPIAAVEALDGGARLERVYNAYNFGGFLIYRGVPVFVDGRAITLYPTPFLQRFTDAYADPGRFQDLAAAHDVRSVLLPTYSRRAAGLVHYLSIAPEWTEAYRDEVAVAFTRADPE